MKPIIVGIGEILWDMLPGGRTAGGAPANVAYFANCLGAKGIIVSSVGADNLGGEMIKHLKAVSLTTDYVSVNEKYPTGTAYASLNHHGQARYSIQPNAAWDHIERSEDLSALCMNTSAICYGTLAQRQRVSHETIEWFVKQATVQSLVKQKTDTTLRVFDVNLRAPHYSAAIIKRSLQMANVVKLTEEELGIIARILHLSGKDATLLRILSSGYNLRLVALTKGEHGSILYSHGEVSQHPGIHTDIADTIGAGDAYVAAMILAMLNGLDLDSTNDYANRVAAYVCSKPGATPPIPDEFNICNFLPGAGIKLK